MKSDIEIALSAELKDIRDIAKQIGAGEDDIDMYGRHMAKLTDGFIDSISGNPDGKLILVTAINPTPAGEGKTTVTIGLGDALSLLGNKTVIALREPSLGPCFGVKVEQQEADTHRLFPWISLIFILQEIFMR